MSSDADKTSVPTAAVITVMVIEDHREFRDYLMALISGTPGFRCAGGYRSMEEALARIGADVPDAALIDIGLPGMSGVDGIPLLKAQYPQMLLLVQTVYDDDERIFDALCAGASGYLLKKTPSARLIEGLREVVAGGAPISPEIARRVINLFREIRPPERADYNLTPHEQRILKLLVEGHNYKTAAAELKVTPSTINFHLQKIYEKLQVHSKSEAVAKALRNRLVGTPQLIVPGERETCCDHVKSLALLPWLIARDPRAFTSLCKFTVTSPSHLPYVWRGNNP